MTDQQNLTPLTRALRQAALVAPSDLGQEYLEQADTLDNLIRRTKERGDQHLAERLTAALMGAELALDQQMHALAEQIAGAADVGRDTHQLVQGLCNDQRSFMGDTLQRFNTLEATFREIGETVSGLRIDVGELRSGQQEIRAAHNELNERHERQIADVTRAIEDLRHGGTELSQANAKAIEELAVQVARLASDIARHERQLGSTQ